MNYDIISPFDLHNVMFYLWKETNNSGIKQVLFNEYDNYPYGKIQLFKVIMNTDKIYLIHYNDFKHYSNAYLILDDYEQDEKNKEEYTVVRIPHYIKIDNRTFNYYFPDINLVDINLTNTKYIMDFKSTSQVPSNYNELGINRFYDELENFSEDIRNEIFDDLINNYIYKTTKNIQTILPLDIVESFGIIC